MGKYAHNGGLLEGVLEVGFDSVKYFEGTITNTATGFSISPPAKRLSVLNKSDTGNVYVRIDGQDAVANASFIPGDNIKVGPGCTFTMDFDTLSQVSFISNGSVNIEGLLGFKATISC